MLNQISEFIKSIEVLKTTLRHNWSANGRQESVAEHTWRMALFFLTIQEKLHLPVDTLKVLKMILIHDIPEWLHGDVPNLPEYQDTHHGKLSHELLAARYYFDHLPSPLDQEFYDLFVESEERKTYEAKVAKVFDHLERLFQHITTPFETRSDSEKWDFVFQYSVSSIKDLNHPEITSLWQNEIKTLQNILDDHHSTYDKTYVASLMNM